MANYEFKSAVQCWGWDRSQLHVGPLRGLEPVPVHGKKRADNQLIVSLPGPQPVSQT